MKIRLGDYATGKGKFKFMDGVLIVDQHHADWLAENPIVEVTVVAVKSVGEPGTVYYISRRHS